jgi:exodeoxyribonuclease-3
VTRKRSAEPSARTVVSWNVNGIRAVAKKGFSAWLEETRPDVLGLQEVKAAAEQFPEGLSPPPGYVASEISVAQKKGYSGTALWSRQAPVASGHGIGAPQYDDEGRVTWMELADVLVFNVYFPKGSGTARDNSRVPYKLGFYKALFGFAHKMSKRTGKPLLVMGDFNTAHREVDLANARGNVKNSGFLPEERADLEKHLKKGFVDTYRALHGDRVQYTWWSNIPGVRERNVGWRIDYIWAAEALLPRVKEAFIQDQVRGSDHCPVGIVLANG